MGLIKKLTPGFMKRCYDDLDNLKRPHKKDFLINPIVNTGYLMMKSYYNISYDGLDNLKDFKKEGFMLLPRHNHELDAGVETRILRKSLKRNGYFMMKASLPKGLMSLGGFPVIRKVELDRIMKRNGSKSMDIVQKVKEARDYAYDIVGELIEADDIVVIHPEGGCNYKRPGKLNRQCLDRILGVQEKIGKKIPFVPVDIEYEDVKKFRSKIKAKVKEPFYMDSRDVEGMVNILKKELSDVY